MLAQHLCNPYQQGALALVKPSFVNSFVDSVRLPTWSLSMTSLYSSVVASNAVSHMRRLWQDRRVCSAELLSSTRERRWWTCSQSDHNLLLSVLSPASNATDFYAGIFMWWLSFSPAAFVNGRAYHLVGTAGIYNCTN